MAENVKPVVFKIGGQLFGIDIGSVQSIEKQISVVPVPNATPYIKGIVNLRGEVIPVYSLKRKFNMKDDVMSDSSIIVETNSIRIALEVDEVIEIGAVEEGAVTTMPYIIRSGETKYMTHIVHSGKDLIIIIDVDELLTQQEAESLKKMKDDMS
jgi:purine-binding chemotaxis protein CheW